MKVAQAHLRYLNPMPKNIGEVLRSYKKVLVPELNAGQLRLLLRGTFSQGFRAPSLIELYTGARQTNLAGSNTDPCNGGAAAHACGHTPPSQVRWHGRIGSRRTARPGATTGLDCRVRVDVPLHGVVGRSKIGNRWGSGNPVMVATWSPTMVMTMIP